MLYKRFILYLTSILQIFATFIKWLVLMEEKINQNFPSNNFLPTVTVCKVSKSLPLLVSFINSDFTLVSSLFTLVFIWMVYNYSQLIYTLRSSDWYVMTFFLIYILYINNFSYIIILYKISHCAFVFLQAMYFTKIEYPSCTE